MALTGDSGTRTGNPSLYDHHASQDGINRLPVEHGNAICYSGYREGQSPVDAIYPSYDEIREDLSILAGNWQFLRVYDSGRHAELVLDVIRREGLSFHLMLGLDLAAEVSNPHCPWGAEYSDETLAANREHNHDQVQRAIALANQYPDIVFAVSVGNEDSVEWTDHMVPVERLIEQDQQLRLAIRKPVTFCEKYVPTTYKH